MEEKKQEAQKTIGGGGKWGKHSFLTRIKSIEWENHFTGNETNRFSNLYVVSFANRYE